MKIGTSYVCSYYNFIGGWFQIKHSQLLFKESYTGLKNSFWSYQIYSVCNNNMHVASYPIYSKQPASYIYQLKLNMPVFHIELVKLSFVAIYVQLQQTDETANSKQLIYQTIQLAMSAYKLCIQSNLDNTVLMMRLQLHRQLYGSMNYCVTSQL